MVCQIIAIRLVFYWHHNLLSINVAKMHVEIFL